MLLMEKGTMTQANQRSNTTIAVAPSTLTPRGSTERLFAHTMK
jgi:hypothetical protein